MYVRIDKAGNPWNGTARYKKVKMPKEVKQAMDRVKGMDAHEAIAKYGNRVYLDINDLITSHGGDSLATRRPELIQNYIVK